MVTVVQLAAAVAGVGKGVQAHVGDGADVVGRDVPVHVGDDALGQVVRLDLVAQGQIAQLGGPVPVAADDPLDHALVAVVVAAGAVPVALAGREEQRQILWDGRSPETASPDALDSASGQAQLTKPPVAMVSPS